MGWFLLLLCFFLIISLSSGADTISANQSLSGDQTIISNGENFELGFFKAGSSSNYYVGIWYKKVLSNPPTIVWVANRETPISNRFISELKFLNGNLVLFNESKLPIWSTNATFTTSSNSVIAIILDDGNLVLREYGSSSVKPVWQSFDHPVDTWLPGAKLAYDKRTKQSQLLTSWRSKEDPGVGLFSLEIVPSTKEYISKWNRTEQYWTSGSWNGKIFSLVPEMIYGYMYSYNFSFFDNKNETYFTYSVTNNSILSRFVMDVSGQVQQLAWLEATKQWNLIWSQPRKTQCEVYAMCGAFGVCRQTVMPFCNCLTGFRPRSENDWNQSAFSSGCVRKTDLICGRNIEKSDFLMVKVTTLPQNNSVAVGNSSECRMRCFNDCSCNAYSFNDNKCLIWDGELLNLSEDDVNEKKIYIKVASKDLLSRKKNNKINLVAIVVSVVGIFILLCLIMIIVYKRKRILVGKTRMEGSLVAFVYKDLQIATKNFSEKLGAGSFGAVFKGVLRDSSIVAVKKLQSVNQGEKEFRSEVSTIGSIQHVNLVRLCGFCAEGNSKLLVYDYMPNGSLDSHLFHTKDDNVLNWKTRYHIALGTARGLVYLHEKCRDCIIHCDIKPQNIHLMGKQSTSRWLPKIFLVVKKNNRVTMAAVFGSVTGSVFLLALILLIIYRKARIVVGKSKTTMEGSLVSFVYRDLQIATKNFSDKLGGGGFGSVFKGVLHDQSVVAVKKLESMSQGEKQFRSEVSAIGTIQHVNLVRLRGFCAEGNSKLLVYDYMPKGSLNSHFLHEKEDNLLNWKTRYEIALGIARGLVYLHEKCRDRIIHCDIKPDNILLDADFCPKIADFGLAKLVGRDFSRVLTTMRGTRGYLAPEWLSGVPITVKADVYSYGKMLFELVSGKRKSEDSSLDLFPGLVANVLTKGGDILSLVDSRLNRVASVEEVTKICKVACWCIQEEEDGRPFMSQVEQILEGVMEVSMPPIPRYVKLIADNKEPIVFFTESSSNGSSSSGDSQPKTSS